MEEAAVQKVEPDAAGATAPRAEQVTVKVVAGASLVVGGNPPAMFGPALKPHEFGEAYAKVIVGDKEQQTEKAAKSIAPVWGQTLVADKADEVLIEVWATVGNNDVFLGEATIKVPAEGALRTTKNLKANQAKSKAKVCGQIAVEITAGPGATHDDFEVHGFEPNW